MKILLVEDHRETRQALFIWLTDLGHEVEEAGSLAEAINAAARFYFAILIADMNLPDGSGGHLLRELRPLHNFYAISITGDSRKNPRALSYAAGFAEHLEKPVDLDEMTEALGHAAAEYHNCGPE